VLALGSNSSGATGMGVTGSDALIVTPIVTTNLIGRKIVQVAAGAGQSLMVADDDSVFSCGSNGYGQLGQGLFNHTFMIGTPIVTTNLGWRKIVQSAAGGIHSLLLADDGSVFSFGANGTSGLGIGAGVTAVDVATPIDSTNLGGRKIIEIAAGGQHSLLLADDGRVFSMGSK
jgi:alpha-tubulin suppressor-like RCC1 family protein